MIEWTYIPTVTIFVLAATVCVAALLVVKTSKANLDG